MPTIKRASIVPYTQEQMYTLVDDVQKYSSFVPWCTKSEELQRSDDIVQARLSFASRGIKQSFSTLNRLHPCSLIELDLIDGPFREFNGCWRFKALSEQSSQIALELAFQFSSRLLATMFHSVFHQLASSLVNSFKDRALVVYGIL